MSEIQRHQDASDKEEVRHAVAGEKEMALHVELQSTTEDLMLEHDIIVAKATQAKLVLMIICGLIVVLALGVLIVSQLATNRNEGRTSNQLTQLQADLDETSAKLEDTQAQLGAVTAAEIEVRDCSAKLDAIVRTAARDVSILNAQLNTVIAYTPPNTPERTAALGDLDARIVAAISEYDRVGDIQNQWATSGRKPPCPL